MNRIPMGCQTYTWQMSYEKFSRKLDHIINVVRKAGFAGIEAEICMLGPYTEEPQKLSADLDSRNLKLAALCLVCDWLAEKESAAEGCRPEPAPQRTHTEGVFRCRGLPRSVIARSPHGRPP